MALRLDALEAENKLLKADAADCKKRVLEVETNLKSTTVTPGTTVKTLATTLAPTSTSRATTSPTTSETTTATTSATSSSTTSATSSVTTTATTTATGHRYWRIRCDGTGYYAAQWHTVTEIEYFTASGKIAAGTLAGYSAAGLVNANTGNRPKAYDGTTATGQHPNAHSTCGGPCENGHFATGLDFTAPTDITSAKVYGPNNFGIHYNWSTEIDLEWSDDGERWASVASQTADNRKNAIVTLTI